GGREAGGGRAHRAGHAERLSRDGERPQGSLRRPRLHPGREDDRVGEPLIREKTHAFAAEGVTAQCRPGRGTHSAECVRGLPEVFQPGDRPWVHPERAAADAIAQVVQRCPTGALTFERTDGGAAEPVPARNTAVLAPDGPIYLRGRLRVVTMGG